jgi:hypothetical protein
MTEDRWARAIARIDEASARDPEGKAVRYGERMSATLARLDPGAGELLRIAVRAQHLERWRIPRSARPEGRAGYLAWRRELAKLHADRAAEILREVGYREDEIARVGELLQKKKLATDPEAQTLEDCACLVFLEHELDAFAEGRDDEQVIAIIGKTWTKMSERARDAALALSLSERAKTLVAHALA